MYCIAEQHVLPSLSPEQSEALRAEASLHRLTDLFEAVPDPRGKHGLRYDLPFLLTCLIAALLCHFDGSEAIAQWCRDHVSFLREIFGPRRFLTPSGSLYRWLLPQLDAPVLEQVLGRLSFKPPRLRLATNRLRWMAKRYEEPDQTRKLLLISFPS